MSAQAVAAGCASEGRSWIWRRCPAAAAAADDLAGASALFLLAMGGIHLYLVFNGTGGGIRGILFVLNFVGALMLAVAMVVARGWLRPVASGLSLQFVVGTLLALVLALTVSALRAALDGETSAVPARGEATDRAELRGAVL